MHRLLRNTHLLVGLFTCATVLMYGVSSAQMVHREWLPWKWAASELTVTLAKGLADGRAVARALGENHGVWGDLVQNSRTEGEIQVRINRPGTVTEAVYATQSGETRLKVDRARYSGMLVALHHARGWTHESAVMNLWGVLVGLVSIGLMVLGGTGVYLWFKIHSERVVGGLLLAVSLAFSVSLIVLIRAAG